MTKVCDIMFITVFVLPDACRYLGTGEWWWAGLYLFSLCTVSARIIKSSNYEFTA